jgi:hypothetical protein
MNSSIPAWRDQVQSNAKGVGMQGVSLGETGYQGVMKQKIRVTTGNSTDARNSSAAPQSVCPQMVALEMKGFFWVPEKNTQLNIILENFDRATFAVVSIKTEFRTYAFVATSTPLIKM